MKKWLVLDCHFLAWRAFHTTGTLKFGDVPTGVLYGFLRDLVTFTELHDTPHVVFTFDRRPYKRCQIFRSYKCRQTSEHDEHLFKQVREQIGLLRDSYLKDLGYRNIFHQKGYEADDMIASFVKCMDKKDKAVVISSDRDLFQVLGSRVVIWNPNSRRAYTEESLVKEFGVTPEDWSEIKAMAGCHTDRVPGIQGIGEKKACKFMLGKMKSGSKDYQRIIEGGNVTERNLELVKLPFKGCWDLVPKRDKFLRKAWLKLLESLGMSSLIDRFPQEA